MRAAFAAVLIWALGLAGAANAQSIQVPGLFDVVGVSADDVLNVRDAPNATTGQIIGGVPPNTKGLEIVHTEGRWGLVNQDGRAGWIHMGFVLAQPMVRRRGTLPITRCIGNEPFWSLTLTDTDAAFATPDTPDAVAQPVTFHASQNHVNRFAVAGPSFLLTVRHGGTWTDGMSDQVYGFAADLFLTDQKVLLSGVCTLR